VYITSLTNILTDTVYITSLTNILTDMHMLCIMIILSTLLAVSMLIVYKLEEIHLF